MGLFPQLRMGCILFSFIFFSFFASIRTWVSKMHSNALQSLTGETAVGFHPPFLALL